MVCFHNYPLMYDQINNNFFLTIQSRGMFTLITMRAAGRPTQNRTEFSLSGLQRDMTDIRVLKLKQQSLTCGCFKSDMPEILEFILFYNECKQIETMAHFAQGTTFRHRMRVFLSLAEPQLLQVTCVGCQFVLNFASCDWSGPSKPTNERPAWWCQADNYK